MRKMFPGHYRPTEKEFAELWKNCIFAFDANVLLNLYRYTPDTKDSLLSILEKISDRIWLPYQAAYEYHNRRLSVIQQQINAYDNVLEIVTKSRNELGGKLSGFIRHPSIQIHEILDTLNSALVEFEGTLAKLRQEHPDFLIDDPIKETIANLFDRRVGKPTTEDELIQIYKQGEERYKFERPPGYKDQDKGETAQYSDLVMWFQLITKAKESKTATIFVTDDRKEDWWLKPQGRTIGPRPELIQEISEKAGITFYMYSADPFMKYARKYLKQKVEKKAIDEVREVRQRDEKSAIRADEIIRSLDKFLGGEPSAGVTRSTAVHQAFEELEKTRSLLASPPGYDAARKMTEELERNKHLLASLRSLLASPPGYDAARKMTEELERNKHLLASLRSLLASPPGYDAARMMAEELERNKHLLGSLLASPPGYDAARMMAEELEKTRSLLAGSPWYDSARKMTEGVERPELASRKKINDGGEREKVDDDKKKVGDPPGPDEKEQDQLDHADVDKGDR